MIAREPAFGSSVDWFIGFCVAASSISGAFGGPAWFSIAALAGAGVGAWLRPNDTLVLWYVATLPFIVPQDAMAIRLSIADLFMIPVIVRCAAAAIRGEWRPERSTVVGVLATLVIAFGVATVIGYVRVGRLTPYALVNKDAGLLFQVATYVALLSYAARKVDVLRLARWFVAGVSIANLTALAGIVASRFDVDSTFVPGPISSEQYAHTHLTIIKNF